MSSKKRYHSPEANQSRPRPGSEKPGWKHAESPERTPGFLVWIPVGCLIVLVIFAIVRDSSRPAVPDASGTNEFASLANPVEAGAGSESAGSLGVSTNNFEHLPEEETMSEPEIAVQLLMHGNDLLNQGKTKEAVEAYYHSLHHDQGSEDTHYNIAIALARLGDEDGAVRHYEETLRILPDYAEAHNNLGNILVKRERFDEAIEHFRESLDINPDSASTHNNLGTALAKQGKIAEATIHFAKAAQMVPDYTEAHYNLGNAYFSLGRTDDAIAEFTEVLKQRPGFEPAIRALTRAGQKKALDSSR